MIESFCHNNWLEIVLFTSGGHMQIIVLVIKRLVMSLCMLYTFDVIISSAGILVPINVVSIVTVAFLGLPAIFGLLVLQNFM